VSKPADARTGLESERAMPDDPYQGGWHRSRYAFAAPFAVDASVLDAGSGEGYGAAFLAHLARNVIGVDYAPVAVEHARATYRRENLTFEQADLNNLVGFNGPFDLITCFEVIEHIDDHSRFLAVMRSRLRPGGRLILSTPNLLFHGTSDDNPYHVSEVVPAALRREVREHFGSVRLFGQLERASVRRAAVKMLDPLYLRRKFLSKPLQGGNDGTSGAGAAGEAAHREFVFSRALMRVSPVTVVTARA
jgi:SAM-dependent methyltransferase